jgi:ABC-2 type transport system ATP-binding protein
VETVIPFGTTLRVSGRDEATLDTALAGVRERAQFSVDPASTSLEDVFVNLMQHTVDNVH